MIDEKTMRAAGPPCFQSSKRISSDNHSCETHGLPPRVNEKGSVCGTEPVSTIHWPVRRCHQRSGSVALRAVMASRPSKTIPAKRARLLARMFMEIRTSNYKIKLPEFRL